MVYPIKVVNEQLNDHRDLLFLRNEEGRTHYCYISDFEKLLGSQLSNDKAKKHICKRCLSYFVRNGEQRLAAHKLLCSKKQVARVRMPDDKEKIIQFKHFERSIRLPISVYADFESVLKKVSTVRNNPNTSSSTKIQSHDPLSYGVYVKSCSLKADEMKQLPSEPFIYRKKEETDEDVAVHFMKYIQDLAFKVRDIYAKYDPMKPLTKEQQDKYDHATACYLCKKDFEASDIKVRDHDHLNGDFRGAAHQSCNLNTRKPRILPIFFHNLSMYDSHFIVKVLNAVEGDVEVIPNTEEKYITFTKKIGNIEVKFLDSYRFLPSSLARLAGILPRDKFIESAKHFPQHLLDLVLRKGVYPYDYTDSLQKLKENTLPSKEDFYSLLTESHISDADYDHAKNVWNSFGMKTLGEYSDTYLKVDVLLLADVFENFRDVCLKHYELDPCYYFTAPGLSWDAALKYTKIQLELLQDYEMLLMIESGIRGGLTQCVKRHAKANNPLFVDDYDPSQPTTFLIYYDANNLYGWAMSQALPVGEFDWVRNFDEIGPIEDLDDEATHGYIFDVDVIYPENLHDEHSDMPFLPRAERPPGSKYTKLMTTLTHKKNYVVHYRSLKQALKYGLRIQKINHALKFKQSRWLAPYIQLNTELRKKAMNDFEKDFFKLMNNSVYGKTMEQVRNRLNMKLVVSEDRLKTLINKPNFKDRTIFSENVVAVHLAKEEIYFNKPIYVGQAILDISKLLMYDFHYSVMKPIYGNRISICYMDTDSYIVLIQCNDFYDDLKTKLLAHFDTSDYPIEHMCYSVTNKKVLGKFKDETNSVPISEFVGLRSKMYALKYDDIEVKKLKGVSSYAVKNKLSFDDYLTCLRTQTETTLQFRHMRSFKHDVFTLESTKKALSPFDDKRVILADGVNTLPYGHYKIENVDEIDEMDL